MSEMIGLKSILTNFWKIIYNWITTNFVTKEEFETKVTNSVSINYGTKKEFESKKDSLPDGTVFITIDEFV